MSKSVSMWIIYFVLKSQTVQWTILTNMVHYWLTNELWPDFCCLMLVTSLQCPMIYHCTLALLRCRIFRNTAYYDALTVSLVLFVRFKNIWYIDILVILLFSSYPSSIVITRIYCITLWIENKENQSGLIQSTSSTN